MPMTDIAIRNLSAWKTHVPLRTPFMFGEQEVRHLPLIHMAARVVNRRGSEAIGWAAEFQSPWFDKSPAHTWPQKETALDGSVARAADAYLAAGRSHLGPMRIWHEAHTALTAAPPDGLPPLAAQYGSSLCERAVLDGFGRAANCSTYRLLDDESLGLSPAEIYRPLQGTSLAAALAPAPLPVVQVRHTVGLTDPIRAAAVPDDAVQDGLPHSLEGFVRRYGLTHFKVKIGRSLQADVARLQQIAGLLNTMLPHGYRLSLDANEQYGELETVRDLWVALGDARRFGPLRDRILYVEQPVPRAAFTKYEDVSEISRLLPLIIDEADDTVHRFQEALGRGWSGTSVKTCKGVFKALLNACLARQMTAEEGHRPLLSGEDLTCPALISLHQYLRLASVLGLRHVEANSFHYVPDLNAYLPEQRVEQALSQHSFLYRRTETGRTVQAIDEGHFTVTSLGGAGLGAAITMDDPSRMARHPACRELPL